MKNDEQGTAQKVARIMTMTRTRKGTRYRPVVVRPDDTAGVIDFDRPQRRVPVKHDRSGPLPSSAAALPTQVDGHWHKLPRNLVAWLEHRYEMAARKERRAALVSSGYDRATGRSVVRAVRRKMAGRWDGKPVYGGGAPRWESMAP